MKQRRQSLDVVEPMGIVISSGVRQDVAPRFAAFEWAPGPDPVAAEDTSEPRAA